IDLPQPKYSAAARMMKASGAVKVQVTVDENGNVTEAKAVSGDPFLSIEAVAAAKNAKFKPTLLSGKPVKVTGVIVYNFVPQ
ncbi:MAG: energy transducer TonB, partial [Acidobacteriota bacterium]